MNIQMVDLYGQYLKIKDEIDDAIQNVIRSSVFVKGGKVFEFEENLRNYMNVKEAITCGNGTDALQMVLMALHPEPGDEVITTPFTFVSTLEVLVLLKMKPVLADIDPATFNICPEKLKKKIGPKTRAIVPVHLYGQCAPMEEITGIAREHGLYVIEDMCQALGTDYICSDGTRAKAGTIGDVACNSFFPTKNLGAYGDGGAVFTNDEKLGLAIRSIANHGMSKKYHYRQIGLNSRLDALQAAILDVKLKYLDQYIESRQRAAMFYDQAFGDLHEICIPARVPFSTHSFHQYTLKVKSGRDQLQQYLKEKKIPTMIYYPMPLHLQEAYRFLGYRKGDFPASEECSQQVLSLPMHTELSQEQMEYITSHIIEFYQ
jgi:UDP-2-acetamido-2-deoxy-ribo-hexuluronate aminotransferase